MKKHGTIRWMTCALVLVLPAGILVWVERPARAGSDLAAEILRTPLPREYLDRGMACLASGVVQPRLDELSDPELVAVAEIIGRLMHAYQGGDFGSFLALRAGDLEHAARARAGDLESLLGFARDLGDRVEDPDCGWIEALRRSWSAYYAIPPVARFHFELAAIHLHREGLGAGSLEDWSRSFEALRDRVPGPSIRHSLTIPHRRDIERVAADSGPLRWLDLQLPFESVAGAAGRLVTRFVWDAASGEWFLHEAATTYANGDRVERHLVL